MTSISSNGITPGGFSSLFSRGPEKAAPTDADAGRTSSQRIFSRDKEDQLPEPTNFLSNLSPAGGNDVEVYSHLEQSLTREQFDLKDLRGTLARVQDYAADVSSYKGILQAGQPTNSATNTAMNAAQDTSASSGKLFSLTVTTADGDRVEVEISNHDDSDTIITFKVDGELDAGEREALSKLTDKLGGLGDQYRSDNWLQIGNLDAFDHNELTGFNLQVKGTSNQSFNLQYHVDEAAGHRSLISDLNGYSYNIRVDLDGLKLDPNLAANPQYQQYLDLISETAHAYRQGKDAGGESTARTAVFFLEGMNAVFGVDSSATPANGTTAPEAEPENPLFQTEDTPADAQVDHLTARNRTLIDGFTSGLPDFVAAFDTPVFRPNPDQPMEISTMSLDIQQITEVTFRRDEQHRYTRVNQRSDYESRVSQHLGLAGDSVEHANLAPQKEGGQSYLYRTDTKSGAIERSMTFEDRSKLVAVDQLREQQHTREDKLVIGGKVESHTIEDLSAAFKNADSHYNIANTPSQQRLAEKYLNDYRTIEQLNDFMDGNKVELFL